MRMPKDTLLGPWEIGSINTLKGVESNLAPLQRDRERVREGEREVVEIHGKPERKEQQRRHTLK